MTATDGLCAVQIICNSFNSAGFLAYLYKLPHAYFQYCCFQWPIGNSSTCRWFIFHPSFPSNCSPFHLDLSFPSSWHSPSLWAPLLLSISSSIRSTSSFRPPNWIVFTLSYMLKCPQYTKVFLIWVASPMWLALYHIVSLSPFCFISFFAVENYYLRNGPFNFSTGTVSPSSTSMQCFPP